MAVAFRRGSRWLAGFVAAALILTSCGVSEDFQSGEKESGSDSNAVAAAALAAPVVIEYTPVVVGLIALWLHQFAPQGKVTVKLIGDRAAALVFSAANLKSEFIK